MIVWVEKPFVVAIHDRQLSEHGGSGGIRDDALLASALARPQQLLAYADPPPGLAELAASLTFGLARNHPFVDGNKRTAGVTCEAFIELNGATLQASDVEMYPVLIALADGSLDEAEFATWLREHMTPDAARNIHEGPAHYVGSAR